MYIAHNIRLSKRISGGQMKKYLPIILILTAFLVFGCDNSSGNSNPTTGTAIKVADINITSEKYIELDIAETSTTKTAQITANIEPVNADNKNILYTSQDENIAAVDENGLITAKAVGMTNIIVLSAANPIIFDTVTVTVSNSDTGEIPVIDNVAAIEVNTNSIELDLNTANDKLSFQIIAAAKPDELSESMKILSYSSKQPEIADVDNTGLVTAKSVGNTVITITSESNPEIKKEINVQVVDTAGSSITKPTQIIVTQDNIELDINPAIDKNNFQINAVVKPDELEENKKGIIYRSDNTNIAEVSETGLITANGTGKTIITIQAVENTEVTAKVNVNVTDTTTLDKPASIILNLSTVELDVNPAKNNDTFQIETTVLPAGLDESKKGITYESNSKNVADVDINGLVTAKSAGNAIITVSSAIDTNIAATLNVAVKDTTGEIVEVNDISVNGTEVELDLTGKITNTIIASALPVEAADRNLNYKIEPVTLASINNIGEITAKNTGSGNIIISSESNPDITKSIPLTVVNSAAENGQVVPITGLGFEETSLVLKVGETYQLTPKFTPPNTTQRNYFYDMSGYYEQFIDFDKQTGLITAKAVGIAWPEIKSYDTSSLPKAELRVQIVDENGPIELKKLTVSPKTITVNKDSYLSYFSNHVAINYEPANTTQKSVKFISESPLITINENGIARVGKETGTATVRVQSVDNPDIYDTVTLEIIDPFDKEPPVYDDINPSEMAANPDRMYIKIMFDVSSSTGDLYSESDRVGIRGIDYQSSTGVGALIEEPVQGYISPYGYCEKYKCFANRDGLENTLIAKKNIGINYYVGNNGLYTPVKQTGTTNYELYLVFFKTAGVSYTRPTVYLPIDWSQYNPAVHKNAAKFHITIKDKQASVVFDGFENK